MRSKRHKKQNGSPEPSGKQSQLDQPTSFKIKFNLNRDNLACFIAPHPISNKKKPILRPCSRPHRKATLPSTTPASKNKNIRPLADQKINQRECCQDIVNQSMEVVGEIERKGIACGWEEDGAQYQDEGDDKENNQIWSSFSVNQSFQKSYASTMDYFPHHYSQGNSYKEVEKFNEIKNYNQIQTYHYQSQYTPCFQSASSNFSHPVSSLSSNGCQPLFAIRPLHILADPRTTIMIRNIPNKYTIRQLSDEIDGGLQNTYDFLYLPCDLKNQCNVGYGFINFISVEYLLQFYNRFEGKRWSRFRSEKICVLTYARLQGLGSLIQHFENSKVLSQRDRRFRPIIREYARVQHLIRAQQQQ